MVEMIMNVTSGVIAEVGVNLLVPVTNHGDDSGPF